MSAPPTTTTGTRKNHEAFRQRLNRQHGKVGESVKIWKDFAHTEHPPVYATGLTALVLRGRKRRKGEADNNISEDHQNQILGQNASDQQSDTIDINNNNNVNGIQSGQSYTTPSSSPFLEYRPTSRSNPNSPKEGQEASLISNSTTGQSLINKFGHTVTSASSAAAAGCTTGIIQNYLNNKLIQGNESVAIKVVDKSKLLLDNKGVNKTELQRARAELIIHRKLCSGNPYPNDTVDCNNIMNNINPQITSNHIVPLLASDETNDSFLLVTPYTSSGDLWDKIRYGDTVHEPQARNCIHQLLKALEFMHEKGQILHGDMKPHNILLFKRKGKFIVQLCDYGLAEFLPQSSYGPANKTVPFTGLRGTTGYFSPEQVDRLNYGSAIDLFAVGVILFLMIGGYEPYYPANNFTDSVEYDENYWAHISEDCKDLISKLLELNPEKRITAKDALDSNWFKNSKTNESNANCHNGTIEKQIEIPSYVAPPNDELQFWHPDELPENSPYFEYEENPEAGGGASSCDELEQSQGSSLGMSRGSMMNNNNDTNLNTVTGPGSDGNSIIDKNDSNLSKMPKIVTGSTVTGDSVGSDLPWSEFEIIDKVENEANNLRQ